MGEFVAISEDGKVFVHATDTTGTYATLCGLDGADPALGQAGAPLPHKRIDCKRCQQIIEHAKTYRVTWRRND